MANSNFVVHNGLTVGPLTIDAASGDISTTGNVTFGGSVGVDSIAKGDSSIAITDTGSNSTILLTIDGTARANVNSSGLSVTGYLNVSGNVLGAAATFSSMTNTGTSTVAVLNSTGNILSTGAIHNSLTVNGNVTVTTAYVMPSANAASSLGTSAARWNYIYGVNGNFLSVNANYADLAEKYVADAAYAPGTVLMFGGDKEVTECAHDMCSRVAGVVSTNPAYLMNSGLEGEHTVELALTGRVPTKVRGPIQKGDLMVSAGDGHARAETLPQVGTVIGKALEDFNGDAGVIEVVVGKH